VVFIVIIVLIPGTTLVIVLFIAPVMVLVLVLIQVSVLDLITIVIVAPVLQSCTFFFTSINPVTIYACILSLEFNYKILPASRLAINSSFAIEKQLLQDLQIPR
jgi:hypothetical protein